MAAKRESLWARTATIFGSKAADYQLVDDVEETSKPTTQHNPIITTPQWNLRLIFLFLITTVAAGSFLLWWRLFHHNSTTQISSEVDTLTCGSTNEEAIARGCVIEPMVYGWMPAPCYIADLSSQYTPFSDRTWYSSHNYTNDTIIPEADIWAAKHKHIYTHQYHGQHCLFLWRKLALAVERRLEWLDTKTLNVEHADHCSEVLEDHGIEWTNSSSDVVFSFYTCVRLNWAK